MLDNRKLANNLSALPNPSAYTLEERIYRLLSILFMTFSVACWVRFSTPYNVVEFMLWGVHICIFVLGIHTYVLASCCGWKTFSLNHLLKTRHLSTKDELFASYKPTFFSFKSVDCHPIGAVPQLLEKVRPINGFRFFSLCAFGGQKASPHKAPKFVVGGEHWFAFWIEGPLSVYWIVFLGLICLFVGLV